MFKIQTIRNFSRTSSLFLRQQAFQEQQPPILPEKPEKSAKPDNGYELDVKFTKLKKESKELAQLITLITNKRKRTVEKQIIVEGNQLIKEAVRADVKLNKILFSNVDNVKDIVKALGKNTKDIEFLKIPSQDLTQFSVLQTCPGVIGVFTHPEVPSVKIDSFDISVVCDNVREPQNVGALIRVSNGLPIAKMILPKGNVNPWDTKCIRGSAGSVFHLPIEHNLDWDEISKLDISDNNLVLIADNNIKYYDTKVIMNYDKIPAELLKGRHITVICGGETMGVSMEAVMYAKQRDYRVVNIPVDKTVDSLNVATALGIILFELRRVLMN